LQCDDDYQLRKQPENEAEVKLGACRVTRANGAYDRKTLVAADG